MKTLVNVSIPVILTITLILLLNTGSPNIYGQIIGQTNQTNQTNQTSGQNTTQQQAQQQLDQANQQIQQAQQQKQQAEQQLQQANQTQQQSNQSKQQDPKMNEKLLNYTNTAILALNEDNTDVAQDSLVQIQNALINASGKQVVIVPAPAAVPASPDDSDGYSE
jgi:preprotein translocase subunit SecF